MELIQMFSRGGFVMWPIAILALTALTVIIERSLYFFFTGTSYEDFAEVLGEKLERDEPGKTGIVMKLKNDKNIFGKTGNRIASVRWNNSPYTKIAKTFIDYINTGRRSREEALKRTGSQQIESMENRFKVLSAISHISPLLGILGTVTGIISAFAMISKLGGQVDVTALAGGIWEAMITTAAGLIVAIPAQLAFLSFERIVEARANRMSYIVSLFNEKLFCEDGPSGSGDRCGIDDEKIIEYCI